jgi:hypothetical protein
MIGTIILCCWIGMGIIGFSLYCSNPESRPKKKYLYLLAFCSHCCFGIISLFYGYVCLTTKENKKDFRVERDPKTKKIKLSEDTKQLIKDYKQNYEKTYDKKFLEDNLYREDWPI